MYQHLRGIEVNTILSICEWTQSAKKQSPSITGDRLLCTDSVSQIYTEGQMPGTLLTSWCEKDTCRIHTGDFCQDWVCFRWKTGESERSRETCPPIKRHWKMLSRCCIECIPLPQGQVSCHGIAASNDL